MKETKNSNIEPSSDMQTETIIWKDNMETLYLKSVSIIEDLRSKNSPYLQEYLDLFGKGISFEKQEDEIDKLSSLNTTGNISFSYIDVRNMQFLMFPEIDIFDKVVYVDPDNDSWVWIDINIKFFKCKIVFTKQVERNKLHILDGKQCQFNECEIHIEWDTLVELCRSSRCKFNECIINDNGNDFQWIDGLDKFRKLVTCEMGNSKIPQTCYMDDRCCLEVS